jgi:acyl carrier protein
MEKYYGNEDMQNLYERISGIIAKVIPDSKEKISPEKLLVKDFGADSLGLVDIIMGAEDTLGIEIYDSDFDRLKTVGDCVDLAYEKIYKKK